MSRYGPASAFLLVGGPDISSDTFQLSEDVEELMEETNGLGQAAREHEGVGVAQVGLEASGGLYDDKTAGIVEALQGQGATSKLVSYGFAGDAIGAAAVMLAGAIVAKWKRIAARDGLTKAHAEYMVTGDRKEGVVLHGIDPETAASGDTEGSSVDNGASSANGATADLHVAELTLGGYDDVVVTVLDSTDDVVFASLVAFDAATAVEAQRKTVAGTVERYLAMNWAFSGAGSGQSVTPYVVVNRG